MYARMAKASAAGNAAVHMRAAPYPSRRADGAGTDRLKA